MSIRLVRVKDEHGAEVQVVEEKGKTVNFGRDGRVCHVVFDPQAARVSRVHATMEWKDQGIVFTDTSKEGTIIDGAKLKQSSRTLRVGVFQVLIGGFQMVVEVEGDEEAGTESISPNKSDKSESIVEETVQGEPDEEADEVSSLSTSRSTRGNADRKRKSDASLFDSSESRKKRGPAARNQGNFEEEMENRGKKGPRARKAAERNEFEEETPAKKMKPAWEPVPSASQRLAMQKEKQSVSVDPEDEVSIVASQIAAIPSVSSGKKDDMEEMIFDRGPCAPNETIKYTNLIFRPTSYAPSDTAMNASNVPNFKKFVPKNIKDGRVSVASLTSNNTFHTTINLIDARRIQ